MYIIHKFNIVKNYYKFSILKIILRFQYLSNLSYLVVICFKNVYLIIISINYSSSKIKINIQSEKNAKP